MRAAKLFINELNTYFSGKEFFQVDDIYSFYQIQEPNTPRSTVNWRIHDLVERGQLQRIGRGRYRLGRTNIFEPTVTMKMFKVNQFMKKEFPYLKYILWNIGDVNHLAQHLFNKDILFVEVERNAIKSVIDILRDHFKFVIDNRVDYTHFPSESILFVRPLITGAPTQVVRNVSTTTLEKLLVDIYSDKEFNFLQGYELNLIFENAFSNYTIHQERLLRYASRKDKRETLSQFIQSIKRQ